MWPPRCCIISSTSKAATIVSVGEFAVALEKVLRSFGLSVYADAEPSRKPASQWHVVEANLQELASAAGKGFELVFFPYLRAGIEEASWSNRRSVLRFRGLRGCVKQLSGSERWNRRCQNSE